MHDCCSGVKFPHPAVRRWKISASLLLFVWGHNVQARARVAGAFSIGGRVQRTFGPNELGDVDKDTDSASGATSRGAGVHTRGGKDKPTLYSFTNVS